MKNKLYVVMNNFEGYYGIYYKDLLIKEFDKIDNGSIFNLIPYFINLVNQYSLTADDIVFCDALVSSFPNRLSDIKNIMWSK